jgi:hypothetical protein
MEPTDETAPGLFRCVDRVEARLPDFFLPQAPGVIVAGADFLCAPKPPLSSDHAIGWSMVDVNRWRSHDRALEVAKLGEYWFIGRRELYGEITDTIVEAFGQTPICTRLPQDAIIVAERCNPDVNLPIGATWIRF